MVFFIFYIYIYIFFKCPHVSPVACHVSKSMFYIQSYNDVNFNILIFNKKCEF